MALNEAGRFGLVNAHSVFTHIVEDHVAFYSEQVIALAEQGGALRVTWFLFDKQLFPMKQSFQNSLHITITDPSNAVVYDIEFVKQLYRRAGLNIYRIEPPGIRGHQWLVYASRGLGHSDVAFPKDDGEIEIVRPPIMLQSGATRCAPVARLGASGAAPMFSRAARFVDLTSGFNG